MSYDLNPFDENDQDRRAIWDMLVRQDIDAFISADWQMVEDDFVEEAFFGVDAGKNNNADEWTPGFSNLNAYKIEWLQHAKETQQTADQHKIRAALFNLTHLSQIDINGNFAIAHKKFDGTVLNKDGKADYLNWQTLYFCRQVVGQWKICGFVGYMPYPLVPDSGCEAKILPTSSQHKTAGPYSPVLKVAVGSELIITSGQAAIDPEGIVVGETIEEQTAYTLQNCKTQLAAAGVGLEDVFKVNVYLKDITEWPRFNAVYADIMPQPFPARTAVQAHLPVEGFRVEIEMWAAKKP